jgi:hypothetical protein
MSSQETRENRQEEFKRRVGAGTTRQASAEDLLSELKRLLESSGHPPFAPPPSASIVSASASTAAEPRQSTDIDKAHDSADDLIADGSPKRSPADLRETYGQHQVVPRELTHLRSRRWRIAASGLALGFAVAAGAGLALKPSAPASKSPLSLVPVQEQSNIQPSSGESIVASSDVGAPLTKDSPLPDHMQVGSTEAEINAKESTTKTSAAIGAQRPAEGSNAMAFATTTDMPALANAATGSTLTASQTARLEPDRKVFVKPDGTPIATISANSADSTSPSETPKPFAETATTGGVRVDSSRPSAAKIDLSARPTASKRSVRRIVAKSVKATTGTMAEAPKQPLQPVQPEKAMKSPTAQVATDPAATDPVAAAPTTPTAFAAQSVSRLTHAFVYLSHLPAALIQHPADTNTQATDTNTQAK